ncbi:hypothetical protein BC830DRAFT_551640 [Chytriomyces sp. MP71]|nr:hypothetical protein BC830DRAFT_551640 [Chytriomyces sp. MP71]
MALLAAAQISRRSLIASLLLLSMSFLATLFLFLTGSTAQPATFPLFTKASFITISSTTAVEQTTVKLTTFGACTITANDTTCAQLQLASAVNFNTFSISPSVLAQQSKTPLGTALDPAQVTTLLPFTVNPVTFISLATTLSLHIIATTTLIATICTLPRLRPDSLGMPLFFARTSTFLISLATLESGIGFVLTLVTSSALANLISLTLSANNVTAALSMIGPVVWGGALLLNAAAAWASLRGSTALSLIRRIVVESDVADFEGEYAKVLDTKTPVDYYPPQGFSSTLRHMRSTDGRSGKERSGNEGRIGNGTMMEALPMKAGPRLETKPYDPTFPYIPQPIAAARSAVGPTESLPFPPVHQRNLMNAPSALPIPPTPEAPPILIIPQIQNIRMVPSARSTPEPQVYSTPPGTPIDLRYSDFAKPPA